MNKKYVNKKYMGLFAAVGAAWIPAMASAAGPTLSDVLGNSGISAAGYADASYEATFNKTGGATGPGSVPLHAFDNNANSFMFNQAALTLSYLPTDGFGALVNVIAGEDAKVINNSYNPSATGAFSTNDFALTQGYVQYASGAWTVIGGRYVTLAGAEVIDDTKNTNVSRSLLFTNLEPLVHTGVRGSYKFSDLITAYLGVNNTAFAFPLLVAPATGADTDKHKTIETGASITPNSKLSFNMVDYYGVDGVGPAQTKNNVFDYVATWQATSAFQLVANFDYDRAVAHTFNSHAEGLALYGNYQLNDRWKGSLRYEYVYARANAPGGAHVSAHVSEITATADYSFNKNVDLLGEVRNDWSGSRLFPDVPSVVGGKKDQAEILIKAIYKFGTPTSS